MNIEHKHCRMAIKSVEDSGQFLGISSVFGNVDQGGDMVMAGAFTKTIQEKNGKFPLLYSHRTNVGVSYVEEKANGLECKGFLNLDTIPGREAYSNLKMFEKHGVPFGMSFGFLPVPGKIDWKDGVRILREVKLYENTLTETPMNEQARVTSVKDISDILAEVKAGRRFSGASRAEIESAMKILQALIDEGAAEGTPEEVAITKAAEPVVDHSRAVSMIEGLRSLIRQ